MRSILRLTRFGYLTALAVVVLVLASARDSGAQQGTQGTFFVPVRTGGVVVFANSFTGIIGNNGGFGGTNPLWIARYNTTPGTLPNGWSYQTFWQNADSGTFPGDQDLFNGALDRLQALAG